MFKKSSNHRYNMVQMMFLYKVQNKMADKQKMSYFHFGCRFAFLKKLSFGMYDFLFSFYD
jgi:hypothetical protein